MAAGVRHELLMRALPALRHEMAAPVAAIRMAVLLMKHQLASAAAADPAALAERAAGIENQLAALPPGKQFLRDLELSSDGESITRGELVAQGTALMRAAFDLRGISLRVGDEFSPSEGEPRFPNGAALLYMFLGALGYLNDNAEHADAICIEAEGVDTLRFSARLGETPITDPPDDADGAPRALAIDAVALQLLADGLGYATSILPHSVLFALRPVPRPGESGAVPTVAIPGPESGTPPPKENETEKSPTLKWQAWRATAD